MMSKLALPKGAILPVSAVILLQVAAWVFGIRSDNIAAPVDIVIAGFAAATSGEVWAWTGQTLGAAAGGLAIGAILGAAVGIVTGLFPITDRILKLPVEAIRPVPAVALIPIALLIFGFGFKMEISIVAFATVWPMLILTRSAVSAIESRLLEVARALQFSFLQTVFKVILPAALPRMFVALRTTTGIALIVAVTVEITANPYGLGNGIMIAQQTIRPGLMYALLVWIGFIGWAVNVGMVKLETALFGRSRGFTHD